MWRRVIETAIVGVGIGLAVVIIRAQTAPGSEARWLAVGTVIIALAALQLVLLSRRAAPPAPPRPEKPPQTARRPRQQDLFANELDRRWTGLAMPPADTPSSPAEPPAPAPEAPKRADDEP